MGPERVGSFLKASLYKHFRPFCRYKLCASRPHNSIVIHQRKNKIGREQRHKSLVKQHWKQFEKTPIQLSEKVVKYLLDDLCITLGYCLPPKEQERIINEPPNTPQQFSKAVMDAEGVGTGDSQLFEDVLEIVCKYFSAKSNNDV